MKHEIAVEFSDDGLWGRTDPKAEGYDAEASADAFEAGLTAALEREFPGAEISVEHSDTDQTAYDGMTDAVELTFVDAVVEKYWQSWEWMVPNGNAMITDAYPVEIAEYNSAGIRKYAGQIGATHMREIGRGHSDGNSDNPNSLVIFFAIPDTDGDEWRVADTNGDPVWMEDSFQAFTKLAEECGVSLG